MIITYYGNQFFKVQTGDTVLAFNPISKESKLKTSRFGADVALVSLHDPDFNGVENLTYGEKAPFVISGPGEYETKGIFVKGFLTRYLEGDVQKINTVYTTLFDDLNIVFLGALSSGDALTSDIKGKLGEIDVLFVPVGGEKDMVSPSDAYKLAVSLEAKIIIPMWREGKDGDAALKTFLKESGGDAEHVDKLTLKRRDVETREGDVIVLKSLAS